ncbi:hypothetical protein BV22DRAFT_67067 [Leucogyrophana mollusca]|uniref:Uncharacterized protein n=1 Tax=Leucogyrophana mollusca TaxID=85980 RepID=A0ACB8BWC9_9AGAM|nr:hypothetical protein BV22DRAFT_67067 [Leucogyrophana mollusca]
MPDSILINCTVLQPQRPIYTISATTAVSILKPPSRRHGQVKENKKAHRNGIKKPKSFRHRSMRGVDAKYRKNALHALNGSRKARAEQKATS